MDFTAITTQLVTKEASLELINSLDLAATSLYKVGESVDGKLKDSLDSETYRSVVESLDKSNVTITDKRAFETYLVELKKTIDAMPTILLRLSFLPKQRQMEMIKSWLDVNSSQKCLLRIETDDTIVAGAIVEYGGKYGDYSLKPKI